MKKFLIIANEDKDIAYQYTGDLIKFIESKGCKAYIAEKKANGDGNIVPEEDIDFILVLGGDGTILRAARDTMGLEIPMLGINFGTLGFLADVDQSEAKVAIEKLIAGEYFIQERITIQGNIISQGKEEKLTPALNEISITRQGSLRIIKVKIYVNGQYLYSVDADGVIAATPTGSTGYSMSAGGPIIKPGTKALVLTPICPHTMNMRPIIVDADDVVEFVIDSGKAGACITAEVQSDGNDRRVMLTGDRITVTKGTHTIKLIKLEETSFLQTLNRKMMGQIDY